MTKILILTSNSNLGVSTFISDKFKDPIVIKSDHLSYISDIAMFCGIRLSQSVSESKLSLQTVMFVIFEKRMQVIKPESNKNKTEVQLE